MYFINVSINYFSIPNSDMIINFMFLVDEKRQDNV